MSTREVLVKRPDVDNDDIDDIIGIAQQLQDAESEASNTATVDEVRDVARELDIDPKFVDAAISRLKQQRAEAEAEAAEDAEESAAVRRTLGVAGLGVLGVMVALFLGLTGITGFVTISADSRMDEALSIEKRAQSNLEVVLERQASLAPQLVALAGGSSAELIGHAQTLQDAPDLDAKLRASDALGLAMAEALGNLPPDAERATERADLRHEVSGITNRITVERRRYEDARLAYEQASSGVGASLARGLGLHP